MAVSSDQRRSRPEKELPQPGAEIRSLRSQLIRAQRLGTLGTLAAMVAHEFNNILTPMINYAQMAHGGDEIMREKALRHALEGSSRASVICQALLGFAKAGSETVSKVSLAELVDETLSVMARAPDRDGIRLIKKIPSNLTVTTRPVEVKQVLLNLLLNARQAVLEKGRGQSISITAATSNGAILLRVADTGVGISPEAMERIFEPFFTTRGEQGSGLGLAVCRQIAQSLNASLTVRSQPGKGTVFTLSLPTKTRSRSRKRGQLCAQAQT